MKTINQIAWEYALNDPYKPKRTLFQDISKLTGLDTTVINKIIDKCEIRCAVVPDLLKPTKGHIPDIEEHIAGLQQKILLAQEIVENLKEDKPLWEIGLGEEK